MVIPSYDSKPVISVSNLSFSFNSSRPILFNVSLEVPQGSIYGFLGPNGAGKTTTMRLLTGLLKHPGKNGISLFGEPIDVAFPRAFHQIGTLIETPSLYLHLSAINNLRVIARMRGIDEKMAIPALQWVGLSDEATRKVKQFSLGMKQRLAIAMALLSEPPLLMLDEPVNGLDPAGMVEIRELLKTLNREKGITIFISSHLLNEVEKMCTHIGIIHKGMMKFEGTMEQLATSSLSGKRLSIVLDEPQHWASILENDYPGISIKGMDRIEVMIQGKSQVAEINKQLVFSGANVYEIKLQDGLEDWFMQLTQPENPTN